MAMDIKALTTRDGVIALRAMVATLRQSAIDLVSSSNAMKTVFNNEMKNLGPYQNTYEEMVDFAAVAVNDASGDIEALRDRLSEIADDIEDWLNKQQATSSSTSTGSTGASEDNYPPPPVDVKKKAR